MSPQLKVVYRIYMDRGAQPLQPAQHYRNYLKELGAFKTLAEKAAETTAVALLKGAPHVYIWGGDAVTADDIPKVRWQDFCRNLIKNEQGNSSNTLRLKAFFTDEQWKAVQEAATLKFPYRYLQNEIAAGLSAALTDPRFPAEFHPKSDLLPTEAMRLAEGHDHLTKNERILLNSHLLAMAFPHTFLPVEQWGGGVSLQMLTAFKAAGLEHIRLCTDGHHALELHPWVADYAQSQGWLIGTYDSYHSIHSTTAPQDQTWPTAQMTQELYDQGAIQTETGKFIKGFGGTGRKVNTHAVRPFMEKRVAHNMTSVPYNYYFVDCDATGEVFDDFNSAHILSREKDAEARLSRLEWISNTFGAVVGSEGGNSFAVPAIAVAEGVSGPFFGWDEADMKDSKSEYYRGKYWPPDAPGVFFKPVPLMERFQKLYYRPDYKLPLYNAVYHDCIVPAPHWNNGAFKYPQVQEVSALTDLLYLVPPLYHFNLTEFAKRKNEVMKLYATWSPLHAKYGFSAMTSFRYLSDDRLLQQTEYGPDCKIIVNFGTTMAKVEDMNIPPMAAVVLAPELWGEPRLFSPGSQLEQINTYLPSHPPSTANTVP